MALLILFLANLSIVVLSRLPIAAFTFLFLTALAYLLARWLSIMELESFLSQSMQFHRRANHRFEGTAGKLRLPVPRRLRRRAAPQAERWTANDE